MPNWTTIVSFADDIAVASIAKKVKVVDEKTNIAIRKVETRPDEEALPLAAHKSVAVLISGPKIAKKMEVMVESIDRI